MPGTKPNSIPQWQRQGATIPSSTDSSTGNGTSEPAEGKPSPRATLMEQAAKFLEHEEIRDASRDKKTAFLEGKGLKRDEIHGLLGMLPDEGHSLAETPIETATRSETIPSSTDQKASSIPPSQPTQPSSVAPIITYPEFLVHSQRPPPLITTSRILSALYLSSATAATIYGTSQYLLKPMLESLTVARHTFFETASSNLDILNKKLESVVSLVPHSTGQAGSGKHDEDCYDDDNESETSDPTELFHRDTGTQTSPPFSPSSSSSSVNYLDPLASTPVSLATSRLKYLRSDLSSILSSTRSVIDEEDVVRLGLNDLRDYLHDIRYGRNRTALRGEMNKSSQDQEINNVKAEIRSVKGVLLSARSFPGAGAGRARVSAT
ncbi:hypothetical protein MMC30_001184 [Trapelia coarctata]|nr:hypothetical protein [Trapelia coarctata]